MIDVISVIQAVVRDQLRAFHTAELGVVTALYPHASAGDKNNYGCDVRLRDSGLELKQVPVSTGRIGAVAIPNIDDLVLVQFLHGDMHTAIITGRLYNDQDRPPEARARECVYIAPDDPESGVRRLYLEFPNGNKLTLDDDKLVLEMGQTTLTVNHDGDVALSSSARLTIETQGDTSLKASGNLTLNATGDVQIEGMNVSLKAQANASVEGTAGATVKGAMVKVAGQIDFAPA
jgi:uncharacterized protein involved in type VI secretion and phage assembly